ncbi:hypothetical protein DOY81_002109 [Sarcophaga bullata]|nr:hypothetical protein DOY81_002109 [Sarcophaga bullata]
MMIEKDMKVHCNNADLICLPVKWSSVAFFKIKERSSSSYKINT